MEMCYDGALVMPKKYSMINEEEMTYLCGGSYNLDCSKRYLAKPNCMSVARWLISTGKVTGMTQLAIAKEIFTHAYSYYNCDKVAEVFSLPVAWYCYYKSQDGISIMDGGDTGLRSMVYDEFWNTFESDSRYL